MSSDKTRNRFLFFLSEQNRMYRINETPNKTIVAPRAAPYRREFAWKNVININNMRARLILRFFPRTSCTKKTINEARRMRKGTQKMRKLINQGKNELWEVTSDWLQYKLKSNKSARSKPRAMESRSSVRGLFRMIGLYNMMLAVSAPTIGMPQRKFGQASKRKSIPRMKLRRKNSVAATNNR